MNVKTDMSYKTDVSQDSKYISQIYHIYVLVQIYILMDLGDVLHLYMNFAKSFCIFCLFCVCVCVCQILLFLRRGEDCIVTYFLQLEIKYEDHILSL